MFDDPLNRVIPELENEFFVIYPIEHAAPKACSYMRPWRSHGRKALLRGALGTLWR